VKAYPNPFLPKHRVVVFDNLASGSEVEVMTHSGEVVFRRTLSKGGAGDQIQWDGRNPAGKRVTEGVYFYVVKSPKETKHGKLIVAR
jgi:flagellar hook assembly protein FlgD